MDNKITKKRLSDFLSYEWVVMIIVSVVAIVVWELAYAVGGVKVTVGQEFKYYYDTSIILENDNELISNLLEYDTFSYDVLKLGGEVLYEENNMLADRLSVQEGDVIFTDTIGLNEYQDEQKTIPKFVRAKNLIDVYDYRIYSINKMLDDATEYAKGFMFDGQPLSKDNIDPVKVKACFTKRNGRDNRFRKDYEIAQGLKLERKRIEKIIDNVEFLTAFISDPNNESALFRYTRYEQAYHFADNKEHYSQLIQKEVQEGRENSVYGINIGALKGGLNVSKIMYLSTSTETEIKTDNIVLMAFDFLTHQPDLQYESLSFICSTIKAFTTP